MGSHVDDSLDYRLRMGDTCLDYNSTRSYSRYCWIVDKNSLAFDCVWWRHNLRCTYSLLGVGLRLDVRTSDGILQGNRLVDAGHMVSCSLGHHLVYSCRYRRIS